MEEGLYIVNTKIEEKKQREKGMKERAWSRDGKKEEEKKHHLC